MTEEQELIAKALEISIILTKADQKWLITDEKANIIIKKELLETIETVIRTIKSQRVKDILSNIKLEGDHRVHTG
jgi:hypothetical protein